MRLSKYINFHRLNNRLLKFAECLGTYGLKDAELKQFMFFEID